MSAEPPGPPSPTFHACPCCGHWGTHFPAHCASAVCSWLVCQVCAAAINAEGAHLNSNHGAADTRCLAVDSS